MSDTVATGRARWTIAPYFVVDDVVATANYYRDKLGFDYRRFWGDPPSFCMVTRSGVVIMLSQLGSCGGMRPNRKADPEGEAWDAYVWIEDADALYAEFTSKGVKITRDICDQPYGCRDFDVEDCNGYRLCLGRISNDDRSWKVTHIKASREERVKWMFDRPVARASRPTQRCPRDWVT